MKKQNPKKTDQPIPRQMTEKELVQKWEADIRKELVGRKIIEVRYCTDYQMKLMGWDQRGIVLLLDNGNTLMASRDDEGNGPGALFTGSETLPVIPVI